MLLTAVIINLLATGCALLLIRRGASRRLKLLTLAVGLASLTQTVSSFHARSLGGGGSVAPDLYRFLIACLSLGALYLLALEIRERNLAARHIRLVEHDAMKPPASVPAASAVPTLRLVESGVPTEDVLALFRAVAAAHEPAPTVARCAVTAISESTEWTPQPTRAPGGLRIVHHTRPAS